MTREKLQIHGGETLEDTAARAIDAWDRAERGELTSANAEYHLSFESFATLASVMTPKRLTLLRHVHRQSPTSTRMLAQELGRDHRGVQTDVEALVGMGLIERGPDGLRADYDRVHIAAVTPKGKTAP